MAGFDNGTLQQGVYAQSKQFGAILRGNGDPVPAAGISGDVYLDEQTWYLYAKRGIELTNPWGNFLFQVPAAYQATLRWFSAVRPDATVGQNGDYCLMWGTYPNYGMQPSILGPKAAGAWPANPVAVPVDLNPVALAENTHNV